MSVSQEFPTGHGAPSQCPGSGKHARVPEDDEERRLSASPLGLVERLEVSENVYLPPVLDRTLLQNPNFSGLLFRYPIAGSIILPIAVLHDFGNRYMDLQSPSCMATDSPRLEKSSWSQAESRLGGNLQWLHTWQCCPPDLQNCPLTNQSILQTLPVTKSRLMLGCRKN